MRTAEEFLKQGKYYRAVDAYTLASIYKPDDPLAYAGRAHALFASGEYMSSAYFLARAINIFPQYVNFKIDLNAMIPDKDRLESRIADVKQWIEKTQSAELSFLLAYIYYQLDKPDLALEAINFAAEKMPDSVARKGLETGNREKVTAGCHWLVLSSRTVSMQKGFSVLQGFLPKHIPDMRTGPSRDKWQRPCRTP